LNISVVLDLDFQNAHFASEAGSALWILPIRLNTVRTGCGGWAE